MKYLLAIFIIFSMSFSYAQNVNWSSFQDGSKSLIYLNTGYDFGLTTQVGYGHQIDLLRPTLLTLDYSSPMGENLVDDFKVRFGGQVSIYEMGNFTFSAKVYGVFRRHQTKLVRMVGFGSELSALVGYYKPTWHLAGELGFDKSIVTHLKHSDVMRENFSKISDGWFIPSGGHFFYGIQGSKTIGNRFELSLRAGATNAQFKDEDALLPYYTQLGLVYRFSFKRNVE